MERKTKIIVTLGPVSDTPEAIEALIKAGADCFRIILSQVRESRLRDLIHAVRESSARLGVFVPIMADIQAPKSRIGSMPVETLMEKDIQDLETVRLMEFDIVALPFVRSTDKFLQARKILGASRIPIMAKLEITEALENLDAILEDSDCVLVACGDLDVEPDLEKIRMLQKEIISKASARGKWVAMATQMLGSMSFNRRPLRTESTNVANAVLDGADALMLSQETATGIFPVESVKAMARIALESESVTNPISSLLDENIQSFSAGVAGASVKAAKRMNAKAIIAMAGSGLATILISKWRPDVPILGLSAKKESLRRLNALRGVTPVPLPKHLDFENQLRVAEEFLMVQGIAVPGDIVVAITAFPFANGAESNTIHFHKLAS